MGSKLQELVGKYVRCQFPDTEILENYRPGWLMGLEYDFYLPKYRIAVEAEGLQHKVFTPKFHNCKSDFTSQKTRDYEKIYISRRRKIILLQEYSTSGLHRQLKKLYRKKTFCGRHIEIPKPRALPKELQRECDAYFSRVKGFYGKKLPQKTKQVRLGQLVRRNSSRIPEMISAGIKRFAAGESMPRNQQTDRSVMTLSKLPAEVIFARS